MLHFQKRRNRIRASDKLLVFRFSASSLLLLFLVVVLLLNLKTIAATDWKSVHFLQDGSVHLTVTPYMIVSVIAALLICGAAALLYRRFWKTGGMNQKPHRTADSLRICQQPARKKKSFTFLRCITAWNTDCCISAQKLHWGNIKTSSCIWKRNWKQAYTASWFPKN